MHGFYRIAAVCPAVKVADVSFNTEEIIRCGKQAEQEGAAVALFPELCVTGYTCGDLFFQSLLLENAAKSVLEIAHAFENSDMILVVGLPFRSGSGLYNCAAILQRGRIRGLTPKTFLPNHREFYEKRIFASGADLLKQGAPLPFPGAGDVPVSALYPVNDELVIGVEICLDLWGPRPPSGALALGGANLILNLSASNAVITKAAYRRSLVTGQSARCMAVYAYASTGVGESTTDTVYDGHLLVAENGMILAENKRFQRTSEIIYADADLARLYMQRLAEVDFHSGASLELHPVRLDEVPGVSELKYRSVPRAPFVPGEGADRDSVCREIFQIQCSGLAGRIERSQAKRAVVGLSGGLDSTLALLVTAETFRLLGRPAKDILALTMPGFGTTGRTRGNAERMAEELGVELRTVDIKEACLQHFKDIGHDPEKTDVTYENTQARERTQILMDEANREHGLVVGTGDLSEIALGWCTYNADHMSMYGVNCGVPKTLVRHIVNWYAEKTGGALGDILRDVIATPVSPELLPADKDGHIAQKTEKILGSYDLHDFFLYHFIKYGAPPEKILFLADFAFRGVFTVEEIRNALSVFLRRFFSQQFKRSCSPDGPKIGSICLSPRADWRMPSDASSSLWTGRI